MTTRREFLAGSGALALSACAGSENRSGSPQAAATAPERPAIVLVHGAWHGGWCWRAVSDQLSASGFRVVTPTLTGLGERSHLRPVGDIGLATHIEDILNVIHFEELNNVTLVGHSYAGLVISGVASRASDKIRAMVYLDAIVPNDDGCLIDPFNEMTDEQVSAQLNPVKMTKPGWLDLPTLGFLGLAPDHPKADWLLKQMTPHPVQTLVDRVDLDEERLESISKLYILCTEPIIPGSHHERYRSTARNSSSWRFEEMATGHEAMITEPEKLADRLAAFARKPA